MKIRPIVSSLAWLLATATTVSASLHPPLSTVAQVDIERDGTMTVVVTHDALAFALNDTSAAVDDQQMLALLDGPEAEVTVAFDDGRKRFTLGFHLRADNQPIVTQLEKSPDLQALRDWLAKHPQRNLPCQMDFVFSATLPAKTNAITLQFPEILSDTLMIVRGAGSQPVSLPVSAGETSPPIAVQLIGSSPVRGADQSSDPAARDRNAPTVRWWEVAWRFIRLGFVHIIPGGLDHCLFVLGLFLLVPRIKPVLWQISAFTVAHTITLTLTSLNIVGMPSTIVEPAIAASIAFIAVENLLTTKVHRWRYVVAFIFGLVHGMGVATAFHEAGFPPGQLVQSLAAFTVGVEGGHMAVLAVAFLALGWTKNRKWYRKRVAIPLSLIIAAIALFWMVQRIAGG